MSRLRRWWLDLNSSLWFVPALMTLAALGAAYVLVRLDAGLGRAWTARYPLLFGAGAAGARGMLTAIAGSMITVAGLTFSLTLATLAQVASQYTSRLLRNFMRDRTNQVVMGAFVSVFVYCLVVLRTIRGGDEGAFVPALAVAFGLVLALGSIGMLIFFIHHIAASIQAANVIARVAEETAHLFDRLFPLETGAAASHVAPAPQFHDAALAGRAWVTLAAPTTGYVQGIDTEALLNAATAADVVVRMEVALGSFVAKGSPLAAVAAWGAAPASPDTLRRLRACYSIGRQRTLDQDAGFGLRQLVDIALKALSPGINDTSTAVQCLDHLGALLALLASRPLGYPLRTAGGRVRVLVRRPDFATYLGTAFDQIRACATDNLAVYLRLFTALTTIAARTAPAAAAASRRAALRRQSDLTLAAAQKNLPLAYDLAQVQARHQQFVVVLENSVLTEAQQADSAQ